MHPGAVRLEQIGGPIPAITRFQDHLGIRTRLRHRHRQRHRIIVDPRHLQHLAGVVHPNDHRPATMQINTDILLLAFHQGFLPSLSGWCGNPECASHTRHPSTGGTLAARHRSSHEQTFSNSAPRTRTTRTGHAEAASRFFMTSNRCNLLGHPVMVDDADRQICANARAQPILSVLAALS